MKRYLSVIIMIAIYNISYSMFPDSTNKIEICFYPQTKVAIINNRTQSPIPYEVGKNKVISLVIPLIESREVEDDLCSLLLSLNSEIFGLKPSIDFIFSENAITKFDNELFPKFGNKVFSILYKCQDSQKQKLIDGIINCTNFVTRNYLETLIKIPEYNNEILKEKIDSYFSNILQKIEILVNMLSPGTVNEDEQYKLVSMSLIKNGEELYNKLYRKNTTSKQKIVIEEYDQDCRDRAMVLTDLFIQKKSH